MFRFLLSTFLTALAVPFYLKWGSDQAESQVDKMQRAVHGTPGAEAPVPPVVMLGGVGLLAGHWLVTRLLGMRFWQSFLSLSLAVGAGFGFYFFGASSKPR
jgi:UDP-N-acetylmuramyl pentapeptide phosphotransferase/UDP-N-acetylglucosamine-1-phosphate transferase